MKIRLLSRDDVHAAVDMAGAIMSAREAFGQLSGGRARVPQRLALKVPGGTTLTMPGWLGDSRSLAVKVVSVFGENRERGLPSVHGLVLVLDGESGAPRALIEGESLTALRTGAASGLATDLLADPEADVVALFGAGVQARAQLRAVREVRTVREVRIVSRSGESARHLATELRLEEERQDGGLRGLEAVAVDSPAEALAGARIVVAATDSPRPVFDGATVEPGTHVNGVGSYTPEMREVDEIVVARARVVVDSRTSALAEAGDVLIALRAGAVRREDLVELGEIVNGARPPGREGKELSFFKSVGHASQDVALAERIVRAAERRGLGTLVTL